MKNIISISIFNEIVKGIKAMKADLVLVNGDMLIGTDNSFIMLKTYKMDVICPITPFTIITKTLSSEFFNNITDTDIIIDDDINKIYCPNNKSYADNCPIMINNFLCGRIILMENRLNADMTLMYEDLGDITDDEAFQRFKNIKAGEGSDLYIPKGIRSYGMYLYSGAIPMTKTDKINLKVYNNGNTFISQFTVQKKKTNPVNIYFRFVKLVR